MSERVNETNVLEPSSAVIDENDNDNTIVIPNGGTGSVEADSSLLISTEVITIKDGPPASPSKEKIFNAFKVFIEDCGSYNELKSVALYDRLLQHTEFEHTESVDRHLDAFRRYYNNNEEAILARDEDKLEGNISYNDKIYIPVKTLLSKSTTPEKNIIWSHLLGIGALMNPESGAKDIFSSLSGGGDQNTDFLSNMMNKVSKAIDPSVFEESSNPMEAVQKIMSGGALTDIIQDLDKDMNGENPPDLSQIMGMTQKMLSGMGLNNLK